MTALVSPEITNGLVVEGDQLVPPSMEYSTDVIVEPLFSPRV